MLKIIYLYFYLFGVFVIQCSEFDTSADSESHGFLHPYHHYHYHHYEADPQNRSDYKITLPFLVTLMCLSSLMCLILLGALKGLIGICCWAPVGMWSLGALIDLPRPLESYQELELVHYPVVYDQTGWPVHPQTGKRSVRALSKRTEFFLNTIFFLAYPIAVVISMCGSCCFKETANDDQRIYKCVNTVVFNTCVPSTASEPSECSCSDEESLQEQKDTEYVMEQMLSSQASLQKVHSR